MRTRLAALLALVTMAFSITGKAFANDCVHGVTSSAEIAPSEHDAHGHPGQPVSDSSSPDSNSPDSCRYDAMTGCTTSAQVLAAPAAVVDGATETTVAPPPTTTAVDLIRSHAAFHPPRD